MFCRGERVFWQNGGVGSLAGKGPSQLVLTFTLPVFLTGLLRLACDLISAQVIKAFLKRSTLTTINTADSLDGLVVNFLVKLSGKFTVVATRQFKTGSLHKIGGSFTVSLALKVTITTKLAILNLLFLRPVLHFLGMPRGLEAVTNSCVMVVVTKLVTAFLCSTYTTTLHTLKSAVAPLIVLTVSIVLGVTKSLFFIIILGAKMEKTTITAISTRTLTFIVY